MINKKAITKSYPLASGDTIFVPLVDGSEPAPLDPAAWVSLGAITAEGIVEPTARSEGDKIRVDGQIVVDEGAPEFNNTWTFSLAETKNTVIKNWVIGETVELSSGRTGTTLNKGLERFSAFLIKRIEGAYLETIHVPSGKLARTGDITRSNTELKSYGVTLTAFADQFGNPGYIYEEDTSQNVGNVSVNSSSSDVAKGTVSPAGVTTVAIGEDITITATPVGANAVKDWIINGLYYGKTDAAITIEDLRENYFVQAIFG